VGTGERSESGDPIYRYTERKKDFELAIGDGDSIEKVGKHIEQHIGKVETVFHEIVSDLVHVDVHFVPASKDRDFHTLVTSGMSDKPMQKAPNPAFQFAELMISLPPTWIVTYESFKDERNYWPIRWLKILARFPHEYDSWIWQGHTLPNGDPPQPFATNTKLCCLMLLQPLSAHEEFGTLAINDKKTIHFFTLVPLYKEEMEFKLRKGVGELLELFNKEGITDILDISRKNVCKRSLWPF
jgi:hypothetical protein